MTTGCPPGDAVTSHRDERCSDVEPTSEPDLVARLRRREASAFDHAYDAHRQRLFSYLLRLTRDRALAEDLLQETWLRLATHADLLRPDTCLAAWLFTVARNLFLSHQRSRGRDAGRTGELGSVTLTEDEGASPFHRAVGNELQRRLESALARLPQAHRDALLLVAVAGFEPSRAAEVCGVRPEAMRQRLARARAQLTRLVADCLEGTNHATRRVP